MGAPSDTPAYVLSVEIAEGTVSVSYVSSLLRIVQAALREVALNTDGAREHFEGRPQPLLAMPALAGGDSLAMSFVFVDPGDGSPMEDVSAATFGSFLDRLQAYVTSLPQPSLFGGASRRPTREAGTEVDRRMDQVYAELRRASRVTLRHGGHSLAFEGDRLEIG